MLEEAGLAALFGLLRGTAGYLKNQEDFNFSKLGSTMVVYGLAGAGVGVTSAGYGELDRYVKMLMSAGVGELSHEILKGIYRKYRG